MPRGAILLLLLVGSTDALVSSLTYMPVGSNPTLYTPGVEPIVHLDYATFADTVFGQHHSFLVEFYADWCGHCRAFAPFYREFAAAVRPWSSVVTVAAINCADFVNKDICSQQGISGYPMMKYFPRNAQYASDAILLDTVHQVSQIKTQLARAIVNEYNKFQYPDWPNFLSLTVNSDTTYGGLWYGVAESANYLAIIFEQFDSVGGQFLLDLSQWRHQIGARRAMSNSPLVSMLRITRFPYVVLLHRDRQQAVYMNQYTPEIVNELMRYVSSGIGRVITTSTSAPTTTSTMPPIVLCDKYPERCRDMFFVSETDMLKSMRVALLDEVTKLDHISLENFTALYNFVDLLAEHFPVLTFSNELTSRTRNGRTAPSVLKESERARLVFTHLRQFLRSRFDRQSVSSGEWEHQFQSVERVYGNPFPMNASWQHCKGSSPELRGYTCGLWNAFHALTVHTYMDTIKENIDPLKPLNSIRAWINSFFGCIHCRQHFMRMTTKTFPMTERRVRHSRDMIMYLWRAHNIVNKRLHGDSTEDPQFEKRQFPAFFLCPTCYSGGQFSRRQVRNFLLRFYGNIQPHNRLQKRVLHL